MSAAVTPNDYKAIRSEIANDPGGFGYASMTPTEIVQTLLFRPLVPNEEKPPMIDAPLSHEALLAVIPPAVAATFSDVALADINQAIADQDRDRLAAWVAIGLARGKITPEQADAIRATVAAKVPDPHWPGYVPGPNRLEAILRRSPIHSMSVEDVEAAVKSVSS